MDYYISFGIHYYGLIYAWAVERDDPERARTFKERAARFAGDFLYWFEDGGRAVPFGRSLTYRFAQGAFFSALALAGVEAVPTLEPLYVIAPARMLAARDYTQVQLFPAGQHCVNELGHCGAKYEKLVYSSRFGFSVPRGDSLEEGAFDCCLAVSEAGQNRWKTQRGFEDFRLEGDHYWRKFSPLPGVTAEVTVTPDFPAHRRDYVITTDRPIDAADGGFAIPAEDGNGHPLEADMVEWEEGGVAVRAPWGTSAIRCLSGGGEPVLVKVWPNTNLLHPLTRIPTIRLSLPAGTHRFATLVTGTVPKV